MQIYLNKAMLYKEVEKYKNYIGYEATDHSIDLISICKSNNRMALEELDFRSKALRGMAFLGKGLEKDIILLNKNRTYIERNFDCGHEVMHLLLHRNATIDVFNCIDNAKINQNPFYEWQANEGSAEFSVPYKALLPMVKKRYDSLNTWDRIRSFKYELSQLFDTTYPVIEYRLESLKYEIYQYVRGTSLNDIQIMSLSEQNKKKIKVCSINDRESIYVNTSIM